MAINGTTPRSSVQAARAAELRLRETTERLKADEPAAKAACDAVSGWEQAAFWSTSPSEQRCSDLTTRVANERRALPGLQSSFEAARSSAVDAVIGQTNDPKLTALRAKQQGLTKLLETLGAIGANVSDVGQSNIVLSGSSVRGTPGNTDAVAVSGGATAVIALLGAIADRKKVVANAVAFNEQARGVSAARFKDTSSSSAVTAELPAMYKAVGAELKATNDGLLSAAEAAFDR